MAAIIANPTDVAVREVYADWLEEAGDPRCDFVRRHAEVSPLPPDHPDRRAGEAALSRARVGCSADWLAIIEPERAHQVAAEVPRVCECFREGLVDQKKTWLPVELDREPQDTECDAWHRLLELVDRAAADHRTTFAPFRELEPGDCERIVTLPPTIARLTEVTTVMLYGSHLVRIPPEIGQMTALQSLTTYTSYRLHWYPYEITRCARLTQSQVSTRALYGNWKTGAPFPKLGRSPAVVRRCSVCDRMFDDTGEFRVWISLRVATDVLPLLVNACSEACVRSLPEPAPDRFAKPPLDEPAVPSEPAAPSEEPKLTEITSWQGVTTSPRLPPAMDIDGVTWVLVDEIEILDRDSEVRHELVLSDTSDSYRSKQRLTYPDGTRVEDRGRGHVGGYVQFRLLNITPHRPVVVVRRSDHVFGNYQLELTINSQRTCVVSCDGVDRVHRWRNWPSMIGAEHVTSDTLVVRQQPIAQDIDVNMFHFWVYQPAPRQDA